MFKKIKRLLVLASILISGSAFLSTTSVLAQAVEQDDCQSGFVVSAAGTGCVVSNSENDPTNCAALNGADAIERCLEAQRNPTDSSGDGTGGPRATFDPTPGSLELPATTDNKDISDNPIYVWLITVVNFLSIGVGIVVTISVAIAGIQYTMSRGDPNKTAAAVNRITQAGIAIFLYVFGWALLNWLIPGGVI